MPAAAVIPAPIAYIKVVAVKKLVVGFLAGVSGPPLTGCVTWVTLAILGESDVGIKLFVLGSPSFTVKKLECLKERRQTADRMRTSGESKCANIL